MRFGLTCALSVIAASGLLLGADAPEPSKYTGPGSCSSPSCHGGVQAREITSVLQNEYSTWVVRDKHAHAFINLTNPVGTRIAKIMGLGKPDTAPRCLACHALDVPVEMRIEIRDAVNAIERNLRALGHRFQLLARQIPVLTLDRSEIVENQPPSSRNIA